MRAKKKFGQHFLKDPSAIRSIIERSRIAEGDVVLEIGAGLGALTIPLGRIAHTVIAVERDPELFGLLKTELLAANISNVCLLHKNILDVDLIEISRKENQALIVIGNLPYNISSQILVRLIHSREYVERAVLMFQKELSDRIVCPAGSKTYGRLSVMAQYSAEISKLAEIKSDLFFPKPKIDSVVLEFNFRKKIPDLSEDEEFMFAVVKAAFGKRRKILKNALTGSFLNIDEEDILRALDAAEIDGNRRAETLDVSEFVLLSNCLGRDKRPLIS
jgi:16S rRNA (adenine1518-N6/adenine1519-N6)-dimethyltransferase